MILDLWDVFITAHKLSKRECYYCIGRRSQIRASQTARELQPFTTQSAEDTVTWLSTSSTRALM